MRFWDSSALVPILIEEATTTLARSTLAEDRSVAVWWGTTVECAAALARAEREGRLDAHAVRSAFEGLDRLRQEWVEVEPAGIIRLVAERLTRTHPVRAGDALQLSAAIAVAEGMPTTLPFITHDWRLAAAADREGFPVVRFGAEAT